MKNIKSKQTDEHLSGILRITVSTVDANIEYLCQQKQCQISHYLLCKFLTSHLSTSQLKNMNRNCKTLPFFQWWPPDIVQTWNLALRLKRLDNPGVCIITECVITKFY